MKRRYGCLEVSKHSGKVSLLDAQGGGETTIRLSGVYVVFYAGQMGTRIETIRECFEGLYGKGSWKRFLKIARMHVQDLTYMWTASVPIKEFEAEFGS